MTLFLRMGFLIATIGFFQQSAVANEEVSPESQDVSYLLGRLHLTSLEEGILERNTRLNFEIHRDTLLLGALTMPQVIELLSLSREEIFLYLKKKELFAIEKSGELFFPPWQFDAHSPTGTVIWLPAVLRALDVPDFSKLSWLNRPNRALKKRTPLEALKKGHIDAVLREARGVGCP